jgi:hypothetical protein
MKKFFLLLSTALSCSSLASKHESTATEADSVWKARVKASACRRPAVPTSSWAEFVTARRRATIRIPPFLKPDRFQAAAESTNSRRTGKYPVLASGWNNVAAGGDFAQLGVGVQDSVKLAYAGPPEPGESICIEQVGDALATILSSNKGLKVVRDTASDETAGPLGPYIAFATMRFPDGLSLQVLGTASTIDQQNQMLAAIRTIRRVR